MLRKEHRFSGRICLGQRVLERRVARHHGSDVEGGPDFEIWVLDTRIPKSFEAVERVAEHRFQMLGEEPLGTADRRHNVAVLLIRIEVALVEQAETVGEVACSDSAIAVGQEPLGVQEVDGDQGLDDSLAFAIVADNRSDDPRFLAIPLDDVVPNAIVRGQFRPEVREQI